MQSQQRKTKNNNLKGFDIMGDKSSLKYAYMYRRISSHNQIGNNSLNAQEQAIKEYAKEHNIKIIGDYTDIAKSGTSIKKQKRI